MCEYRFSKGTLGNQHSSSRRFEHKVAESSQRQLEREWACAWACALMFVAVCYCLCVTVLVCTWVSTSTDRVLHQLLLQSESHATYCSSMKINTPFSELCKSIQFPAVYPEMGHCGSRLSKLVQTSRFPGTLSSFHYREPRGVPRSGVPCGALFQCKCVGLSA